MLQVKSLLFDFGGTLDSDGATCLARFLHIYKENGPDFSEKRVSKAFYAADDSLPEIHDLKGLGFKETLDLQVQSILENLRVDRPGLRDRLADRFLDDCRGYFRRNRPILECLKRRWRLGIVSNYCGNLESVLESEGLRGFFDVVADSGVVGVAKPDAGIFLHAARGLDSRPEECLMVGDSLPRDMKGAEGLKMPHCLIAPLGTPECCADGWTLTSITELESRLDAVAARVEA